MRRILISIAAMLLLIAVASAQNQGGKQTTIQAELDQQNAMVGDSVMYTVTITGSNIPEGSSSPATPGLNAPGLRVVTSQQSRNIMSGSSFTITINGRTVKSDKNGQEQVSISYQLRPERPGVYRLGPAGIVIGGKTYQSNTVTLSVTNEPASPQGFQPKADVSLNAKVSRTRLYVGQVLTVSFFIYARPGHEINQLGNTDVPQLDGFIKNDLERPGQVKARSLAINGREFQEIYLGRLILTPIKAGKLALPSFGQQYIKRVRVSDHPFFGPQYTMESTDARSEELAIEALPLPEAGKPQDFSGAIGRFNIQAESDKRDARAGESVTLTVRLSGTGNLQSIPDPNLNLPGAIQAYPPEKSEQSSMTGNDMESSRALKYILVPQQAGNFQIGPITFKYFDPESATYKEARVEPIPLNVNPGVVGAARPNITMSESEEVRPLGQDIRYIKPDSGGRLVNESRSFYARPWYWAIHALPLFMLAGAVLLRRRQDRLRMDQGFARRVGARSEARRKLAIASKAMSDPDTSHFYLALGDALLGFVADQLNVAAAGLVSSDLRAKMAGARIPDEIVNRTIFLLDRHDAARYAPSAMQTADKENDLNEAERLIAELGKVFEKGNSR